jgi:hypothetical protein
MANGYSHRNHEYMLVQRELDELCGVNCEFADWIASNRPLQRLLLAIICHQHIAAGSRSLFTRALPLSADLLARVHQQLDESRPCAGRAAWEAGTCATRQLRSGRRTIVLPPPEPFAWHVDMRGAVTDSKRAGGKEDTHVKMY